MQRVIVHASQAREPCGRVIIGSMPMKKPVIAGREGGPLEILEDGVNGFLVTPGDNTAFARRTIDCLTDPRLAAAMGEQVHAKAQRCYAVTAHVEAVSDGYRSLSNGATPVEIEHPPEAVANRR